MAADQRLRAALVLIITFALGVAAGAAFEYRFEPFGRVAERHRSAGADTVGLDRIPAPLEALGLTAAEETSLKAIARRWRSQGSSALGDFRRHVSDLENGMFAEMLCVLQEDQRDRYVAQLRADQYEDSVIQRRMELVSGNRCPGMEQP